jgi:hypothetical protein
MKKLVIFPLVLVLPFCPLFLCAAVPLAPYQHNFFTTNAAPVVDVLSGGANVTVTPSLAGTDTRHFTISVSGAGGGYAVNTLPGSFILITTNGFLDTLSLDPGITNLIYGVSNNVMTASNALSGYTAGVSNNVTYATNDLNTALVTKIGNATNDLNTGLSSKIGNATNDLSTVLKARMDSGTNDLSTILKARMDSGTNDLSGVLKTYTQNATNDLNTLTKSYTNAVGIIKIVTNSNPLAVSITGNAATATMANSIAAGASKYLAVCSTASTSINTTKRYLAVFGGDTMSSTETSVQQIIPFSCTFTNLNVTFETVGLGTNIIMTLRTNGVDSSITMNVNGAGTILYGND